MATLTVTPANAYEGDHISLTLAFTDYEAVAACKGGQRYRIKVEYRGPSPGNQSAPVQELDGQALKDRQTRLAWDLPTGGLAGGAYEAVAEVCSAEGQNWCELGERDNAVLQRFSILGAPISTRTFLQRAATNETNDQGLWALIRNRTNALGFERYRAFIDQLFCTNSGDLKAVRDGLDNLPQLSLHGPYAYSVLKLATQVFLTLEAGMIARASPWDQAGSAESNPMIREHQWKGEPLRDSGALQSERYRLNDPGATFEDLNRRLAQYVGGGSSSNNPVLPYLDRIVRTLGTLSPGDPAAFAGNCERMLLGRFSNPSLLELIWSYWHEEGMLAQTMNAITWRFQNQRSGAVDPLAELELDPLRPLNNLLWGYVQDENNRLTVRRRAFEYDHHYGLKLVGRAVPELQTADSRSKFIETFHNLLYRTAIFYREDADTTVIADAFPLLNALKDVHLLLAEGAHNQYGDLPWTSRAEMLTEQWLLARPEMR